MKDNTDFSGGLGDKIANIIYKVTKVHPCETCKKRKEKLNKLFPKKK